jgi:hypothetical protein
VEHEIDDKTLKKFRIDREALLPKFRFKKTMAKKMGVNSGNFTNWFNETKPIKQDFIDLFYKVFAEDLAKIEKELNAGDPDISSPVEEEKQTYSYSRFDPRDDHIETLKKYGDDYLDNLNKIIENNKILVLSNEKLVQSNEKLVDVQLSLIAQIGKAKRQRKNPNPKK